MPINFPDSPTTGDTHTSGDKTWTYDGTAWNVVQNNIADHGNLGGLGDDDHTQYLLADGTRTATELTVTGDLTIDTDTLHVDSANDRVGIGTTTPDRALTVAGGQSTIANFTSTSATSSISFVGSGTTNDTSVRVGAVGDQMKLIAGDTERVRIDASGNVGIGDTTPSYTLDVNGDINSQGYLRTKGKQVGMALVYSGSFNGGTSTFLNVINGDWTNYRIVVDAAQNGNTTWTYFRFIDSSNTAISSNYYTAYFIDGTFSRQNGQSASVAIFGSYFAYGGMVMDITQPNTGDNPSFHISSAGHDPGGSVYSLWCHGYCVTTSDITGVQFYNGAPYGAIRIYGYR